MDTGDFKFELDQQVSLDMSKEVGVVLGRAQYLESNNQYFVKYLSATGEQREGWFLARDLVLIDVSQA